MKRTLSLLALTLAPVVFAGCLTDRQAGATAVPPIAPAATVALAPTGAMPPPDAPGPTAEPPAIAPPVAIGAALRPGVATSATLSEAQPAHLYRLAVPAGTSLLRVRLELPPGVDWRLYLRPGEPPTRTRYECASAPGVGMPELCEVAWPLPGEYSILVDRIAGSGGYVLTADLLFPTPMANGRHLSAMLPGGGRLICQMSADLDGDGLTETAVLAGLDARPDGSGYGALQVVIFRGDVRLWQSERLPSERGERLSVADINADGRLELLSFQAMGAAGYTLYVLAWDGSTYAWLRPQGGYFAGQGSFGEVAARLQDLDGDGTVEILAGYGPAASQTDVYAWDGQAYVYLSTISE